MTPLTQCQTQHKIPAIRETAVAAAHAEAQTVTETTNAETIITEGTAIPGVEANPKAAAKVVSDPRNSGRRHPAPPALMLRPS